MSEFDFEELDKAVNSATDSATQSEPSPAVRRSNGRFMDIVVPTRKTPAPRGGIANSSDGGAVETTPAEQSPSASNGAMPDPIDFLDRNRPDETPEVATVDTTNGDNAKVDDMADPIDSPFIPNVVVEKRPLGSAPAETFQQKLMDEPSDPLLDAPDEERLEAGSTPITDNHAPDSPDQPRSAVYDTGAYTQDLPNKKMSKGLKLTIWLVILLILGVLSGIAAYFLVFPNL